MRRYRNRRSATVAVLVGVAGMALVTALLFVLYFLGLPALLISGVGVLGGWAVGVVAFLVAAKMWEV